MTEPVPDPQSGEPPADSAPMPRWVPMLIGGLLVVLAALAVLTGLRYHDDDETLVGMVKPATHTTRPRTTAPAPPGEPGAGASLVFHGDAGENTPEANAPIEGPSRAVVTGNASGVEATVRIWARRGVVFNVLPDDTMVYVNELPIGPVRQFNTMDEVYDFAEAGSYNIRLVAPGGKTRTFVVTAAEDAKQDIARINAKLE
ncbi:MAG: hypothetical protein JO197_16590 [Acidobacteria bacterium]|nr:hypothetical protein [Acidobacteriota bacterium]MBV9475421.1 hypothetical protein [Acidobacteriota bacterium]